MANYYNKVSTVFWKSGNALFHACTLHRLYHLSREMRKNLTQEEMQRLALNRSDFHLEEGIGLNALWNYLSFYCRVVIPWNQNLSFHLLVHWDLKVFNCSVYCTHFTQNVHSCALGHSVYSHHPWAHWYRSSFGHGWHHCGETPQTGYSTWPTVSTHPSESHQWHGNSLSIVIPHSSYL